MRKTVIEEDKRFRRHFFKLSTEDIGERHDFHYLHPETDEIEMIERYFVSISYSLTANGTIIISIHGKDLCVGLRFHYKMEEITDKIIKLILDQEVITKEWVKEVGFGTTFKEEDYDACMKAIGEE